MKKILIITNLMNVLMHCKAQITLEQRYTCNTNGCSKVIVGSFPFSDGRKYVYTDQSTFGNLSTIYIQNTDHSNYKTISIPTINPLHTNAFDVVLQIIYVTDNLFDLDAKTEYLCQISYTYNESDSTARYNSEVLILNENGNVLFRKDSASVINNLSQSYFSPLVNTETGSKLILNNIGSFSLPNTSFEMNFSVYSLPGLLTALRNSHENQNETEYLSAPFPNPTNDYCTIFYKLPQNNTQGIISIYDLNGSIIKNIEVSYKNEYILFNNQNLNDGIYFYSLFTEDALLETKKFVVKH